MVSAVSTRFRTDAIGSLIRPPAVLAARAAFKAGRVSEAELRQTEDSAILEALQRQREIGIEVLTDGEMRRAAWMTEFSDAVGGFAADYPVVPIKRPDGTIEMVELHTKHVVGRLRQQRRLTAYEVPFLRAHTGDARFKITLPSPNVFGWGSFKPGATDPAYATREELHEDAIGILQREMQALVQEDRRHGLAQDIAAENRCYDALPRHQVVLGSHLCRGNRNSWGGLRGGYDAVAEQLFNELHVDRFLLEYDTERAGSFEPLRFLPKDKTVVLGLVTTKSAQLESADDLKRRIDEAARYCGLDQLAVSPQCGFFHGEDDDTMTVEQQWQKLRLVVDTARDVWGT